MDQIVEHSEISYPNEACGLLLGRREGYRFYVDSVHGSSNVADTPETHFEVDPQLRFDLERLARKQGKGVIGVYHSHPTGVAKPSGVDLSMAWEIDLVWLISALKFGKVIEQKAYAVEVPQERFVEIGIQLQGSH